MADATELYAELIANEQRLVREMAELQDAASELESQARAARAKRTVCKLDLEKVRRAMADAGALKKVQDAAADARAAKESAEQSRTEQAAIVSRLEEKEKQLDALLAKAAAETETPAE